MQKQLKYYGNMCYLYLSKTMIQLLQAIPGKHNFLFTIKNKTLFVTKVDDEKLKELENPLIRKIQKVGTGHGIFFTQSILELLDINPDKDKVNVEIEEQTLIVKKVK